jgi:hypothetical protein
MPDEPEVRTVTITTTADPKKCKVDKSFRAKLGDSVEFVFEARPDADIIFSDGSPFEKSKFKPSSQTVTNGPTPPAKSVSFDYTIEWPGEGKGGGSGEVIGG